MGQPRASGDEQPAPRREGQQPLSLEQGDSPAHRLHGDARRFGETPERRGACPTDHLPLKISRLIRSAIGGGSGLPRHLRPGRRVEGCVVVVVCPVVERPLRPDRGPLAPAGGSRTTHRRGGRPASASRRGEARTGAPSRRRRTTGRHTQRGVVPRSPRRRRPLPTVTEAHGAAAGHHTRPPRSAALPQITTQEGGRSQASTRNHVSPARSHRRPSRP